ncbi:ABC transporter permease [Nocardia sp. NPDC058379]|uniref:ABC transporter permease n=1 Tax=unclassified Nocardia TaxID=2637762 RepID=UPI003662A876
MSVDSVAAQPATERAYRRWLRRYARWIPVGVLVLIALAGPALVPFDPQKVVAAPSLPPGAEHLMGTDSVGIDVFSATIVATRLDLLIGFAVTVLASTWGVASGLLIGMTEQRRSLLGRGSRTLARAIELSSSLPPMVFALAVVAFAGPTALSLTLVVAAGLTPNLTRLVRTEVLKVRGDAYLDAARQAGLGEAGVVIRHVLPNTIWPVVETFSITFGSAIMLTAGLGFLGVGVPAPTPEWGTMIARGVADVSFGRWWAALFPAMAMAISVGCVALATRRGGRRFH